MIVGGTIGNMEKEEVDRFFKWMGSLLKEGDMIIVGADMKKDPVLIQNAYFNNS